MKKLLKLTFVGRLCICIFLTSFTMSSLFSQTTSSSSPHMYDNETAKWQSGKIYLKIKNSSTFDLGGYPYSPVDTNSYLQNLMNQYGVTDVFKPFVILNTPRFDRTYRITFSDTIHTDDFINAVSQIDFVEYAERVPMMYPQIVPNDPMLASQYYWNMINANGASNIYQTNPGAVGNTIVAIVDDAVLTSHEDLTTNIFSLNRDVADLDNDPNPPFSGIAATNGIRFSHGTHVAGIAGAETNNAIPTGVASVGWSNNIMGIKTRMSSDPGNGLPFAFDGVVWAIANGAQVINMSWGGGPASITEYNIMVTAQSMGIVLIAAAGNSGIGTAFFPAAYGEGATGQPWEIYDRTLVIAVAALDINNDRSLWPGGFGSNFGQWVDISAYGTAILSSISNSSSGTPINNQYSNYNGTSMAAPMVSGVAGIMRSFNTSATPTDIYNCLVYSANPDIYGPLHSSNTLGTLGYGRLDAEAALQCLGVPCANNPIAVITPSSMSICPGGTVTLTANQGVSYLWSTGATTQGITINTPGTYTVTVTFIGGCTNTTSITISNVNTNLSINFSENSGFPNDGIMCGPGSSSNAFTFCASATGSSYVWNPFSFMNWGQCTGVISLGSTVPDSFTMTVSVTDMNGCVGLNGTASFTVSAVNPPTVTVTPSSSTICVGQQVTLTASGADSYTWSPATGLSATTGSIVVATPTTTITYTVTGVDNTTGCENISTVTVTVNPLPIVTFGSIPSVCSGSAPVTLTSGSPIGGTYSGTGVSGNIFTPPIVTTTTIVTLTYTYTDANGCTNSATQTITVNPLPVISVTPPSPTITVGGNVSLLASGASTYSWVPATGLSCTNCPNPIASPTVTTTYTVTGTDANGCMNTTTVTVTVIPVPGCTSCTPLATSGTLSTSPAGFQTYCINNNITITGTVNFNISEFKMAPGVIVTVDPGAILSINGSHIYSCSDMWQGIVVKPGGRVIVQNFTLGSFINRSSLIEDAFVAIDIPSLASVTNNPLTVDNATFNRNQISIRIDNYSTTSGPTTYPMSIVNSIFTCRDIPFTPNSLAWPQTNAIKSTSVVPVLQSPFINNTTYSQSNANAFLKPPFSTGVAKPLAGIRLSRVGTTLTPATPTYYEIKIGAPGVPKFNVFDNLSICIDAENSNFTCVNNVFQNNPASQKTGIAINAIARELFNCRLQVIPAAANNFINKFYDCGRAINSVNYYENIATNCEVRSSVPTSAVAPVAPTLPFLGQYGFFAVTNRFRVLNFSNNTMYNIVNGITFNANFGPYQVGGFVPSGQYSGQVNINSNTIQPHAPGNTITTQYVANAITVTNVVASGLTLLSGTNVSVNNNIISSVYRGIGVDTWSKKDVKTNNNTITMVADPFFIPAPPATPTTTPLQYGIGHRANAAGVSFGNSIVGNTITGPGIGTNPNVRAIVTAMCSNQIVRCNIVSNSFKGIEFNGNNSPTSFNHNDMTNHRFGFVLDNAGFIGVQGNSTNPSDNRWLGTWTGGNFRTATLATTTASTAIGSELWVRNTSAVFNPNGSGTTQPPGVLLQDNYFNNGSAASTLKYITNNPLYAACPISICCLGPFPLIANMEKIVQDQDSLYGNVPQTRYINKNKVYRMLRQDQSLMTSSPVLQNFYNDGFVGTKEVLASVEDDLAMSDITSAETKTNGLVPQNTIEQNYKTFFEIYLKQQTDTVSYNDSVNIVALALGCPFTDGEVVYQARALYNSIYMTNVIFEDNCSTESREFNLNQNTVVKNQKTSDYKVYPNPSTGEFIVELNSDEFSPFSVRIADMQNRTIYTETSFNKQIKLKADVENGAYMLHITNIKTNVTVIQKLVIQK